MNSGSWVSLVFSLDLSAKEPRLSQEEELGPRNDLCEDLLKTRQLFGLLKESVSVRELPAFQDLSRSFKLLGCFAQGLQTWRALANGSR